MASILVESTSNIFEMKYYDEKRVSTSREERGCMGFGYIHNNSNNNNKHDNTKLLLQKFIYLFIYYIFQERLNRCENHL